MQCADLIAASIKRWLSVRPDGGYTSVLRQNG